MSKRVALMLAASVLVTASPAWARSDELVNARLHGFSQDVTLGGQTHLTYLAMVGLGVVGLAVMFVNAKRSHLD
jgi:hypothetical protein